MQNYLENAYNDILAFWFSKDTKSKWFIKDKNFDAEIEKNFLPILQNSHSILEEWQKDANSCLALIILFDQFPRNIFRGDKQSFSFDETALQVALYALEQKYDEYVSYDRKSFFYMPLMHSENLSDQLLSVQLFEKLGNPISLDFANQHLEIIQKFSRFPHRNLILNRQSTKEELSFLKENPGF